MFSVFGLKFSNFWKKLKKNFFFELLRLLPICLYSGVFAVWLRSSILETASGFRFKLQGIFDKAQFCIYSKTIFFLLPGSLILVRHCFMRSIEHRLTDFFSFLIRYCFTGSKNKKNKRILRETYLEMGHNVSANPPCGRAPPRAPDAGCSAAALTRPRRNTPTSFSTSP